MAFAFALLPFLYGESLETVEVVARPVERTLSLPGEFEPFQTVGVQAKITGFVEKVLVDRGTMVKEGELLAIVVAPELKAQRAEAEARVQAEEARRAEAEARFLSAQSTYERLKTASATPGAIAGNELVVARQTMDAARAQVKAVEGSIKAAQAGVKAIEELEQYLNVTAPFSGVITERNVHPGALVGPNGDKSQGPMFRLEQNSRLRLVVAVPEVDVSGIPRGAKAAFTVPAYPGQTFSGTVARLAHSMDVKTRAMAVELDVANARGQLSPGMYPTVAWPVKREHASLVVPATAVVTTTERTFVVRVRNGAAEWVTVTKGPPAGPDNLEVVGPLAAGDQIVKRASDEIRPGTKINQK